MKVTFADFGAELASSRLRAIIPQKELSKLGIEKGKDVLVYGKHWVDADVLKHFDKKIYDVCDDHFSSQYRDYYIRNIQLADAVTCNSEVMKSIIYAETGVTAHVINEPYESEEREPSIDAKLFWYGHGSNLRDLQRVMDKVKQPLMIMSNTHGYKWTPENFARVMSLPLIVIIPTGKSMAKSENRMVESIRNGKFVCAEYLPAYEPFYNFFPCGEITHLIDNALKDPEQSIANIKDAQDYIRDRYSPATIAKQWLEVINEHI